MTVFIVKLMKIYLLFHLDFLKFGWLHEERT
jgi:hypothetical protein